MTGRLGRLGGGTRAGAAPVRADDTTGTRPRGGAGLRSHLRPVIETVLAGALLGGAVALAAGQLLPRDRPVASAETPVARQFMTAVFDRDTRAQEAVLAETQPANRALLLQELTRTVLTATPVSLTYLGGGTLGPWSVDMYALEMTLPDGTRRLVPFSLTSARGQLLVARFGSAQPSPAPSPATSSAPSASP